MIEIILISCFLFATPIATVYFLGAVMYHAVFGYRRRRLIRSGPYSPLCFRCRCVNEVRTKAEISAYRDGLCSHCGFALVAMGDCRATTD